MFRKTVLFICTFMLCFGVIWLSWGNYETKAKASTSIDSFAIQLSDGTTLIYLENNISTEKFVLEKGLAGADGSFGFNFTNQKLIDPDDVVKIIINEKEIEDNVSG